jgi:hypothetical protein
VSRFNPISNLNKKKPDKHLFSFKIIFSLLIQILILIAFQILFWIDLNNWNKEWFVKHIPQKISIKNTYESTSIFLLFQFQVLNFSIIFSSFNKHFKPIYHNCNTLLKHSFICYYYYFIIYIWNLYLFISRLCFYIFI